MPIEEQQQQQMKSNAPLSTNKLKINDGTRIKEFNTSISETKQYAGLNRSNISPKVELPQLATLNESTIITQSKNNNLDLTVFSDSGLNTSINNNSSVNIKERQDNNSSPSDMLWSQMKQQLSLREKLRGKKKELEDLIKNERYYLYEKMNKSKSSDTIVSNNDDENDEDYEENEEEEETNNQGKIYKTASLDDSIIKKQSVRKQENICSADELIMQAAAAANLKDDQIPLNASLRSNSNLESSLVSSVMYNMNSINDLKKQLEENNHTFECMLKNQNMLSSLLEKNLNAINNNSQNLPQQPSTSYYNPSFMGIPTPSLFS